jgi:hypothetical protein
MPDNHTGTTLNDYRSRIAGLLERASRTGLEIARVFADAEASLSKENFKALYAGFGYRYSTACKLVKVGKSSRILEHEDKLGQLGVVDAWSTLHEIVKLDEPEFEKFSA